MSKHHVLSFKPQLRLEGRGQYGQDETEQPDHSASLGDSITSSTRIRFSVHTTTSGQKLTMGRRLAFKATEDGQTTRGRLIGSTQLVSGRFAMIDDGIGFSLVPWRPVIEKEIGREVIGVMRGGDVSWQLGRKLGLGI
jgi:hypothetical protein